MRFLFGLHDHQPLGNFDEVFARLTEQAYLPFLREASACTPFRLTVHVSGPLLDWWERRDARVLDVLGRLAADGRAEFLLSGWSEPILAAISSRDRRGQIAWMRERLRRRFGAEPTGLWLTERVFESGIVPDLAAAGVAYAIVDDRHFRAAGFADADLDGPYLTEESGHRLVLFPIGQRLRYLIPFRPADELKRVLAQARGAGARMAIYADDGEKFGGWPGTADWVYRDGWLRGFLRAVEELAADGIVFDTFGGALHAEGSRGPVYLPTASYAEMEEWSLPPDRARTLRGLRERFESEGVDTAFLRGSHWKNFLVRYPESNLLHKKALAVSEAFAARGVRDEVALAALYGAQGNDPYWHGVFGGLYLPHLRGAAWASLARAEGAMRAGDPLSIESTDLDCDGKEEVWIRSDAFSALVAPERGGALVEFSTFDPPHNWAASLARRPEGYHGEPSNEAARAGGGVATIHDLEANRAAAGAYDRDPRALFLDRFPDERVAIEEFQRGDVRDRGDFARAAYAREVGSDFVALAREARVDGVAVRVEKRFRFERTGAIEVRWRVGADAGTPDGAFATEGTLFPAFLAVGGGELRADGRAVPADRAVDLGRIARLESVEGALGARLVLAFDPAPLLWVFPVQTVSRSEKDFDRTTQGIAFLARWPARHGLEACARLGVEKGLR